MEKNSRKENLGTSGKKIAGEAISTVKELREFDKGYQTQDP